MPSFSLAILWKPEHDLQRIRESAGALERLLDSSQVEQIGAVLRTDGAALHLRVDRNLVKPQVVHALATEVEQSQGELVEVWRLDKAARDAFRAQKLFPERSQPNFAAGLAVIAEHLQQLLDRPPPKPAPKPAPRPPVELPSMELSLEDAPDMAAPVSPPLPPKPAGKELRKTPRFAVKLDVEFKTAAEFVLEHATNISRGGLFVETSDPPPLDTEVEIRVRLPSGEELQSHARVAHIARDGARPGVGLSFTSQEAQFLWALDRYLATLA